MRYIKKLLSIFSLVFLLFSLIGCEGDKAELKSPPTLKVLYQDKSIDAVLGTYSWTINNNDGTATGIESDSAGPTELVKDATVLTVSPKSAITLNFSDKPKDIMVNIWQENKSIEQLVTDSKVITPELKGSVIYEAIATWEQGTAHYAFLVNVN